MIKQIICLSFAAIVGFASAVSAGTYSGGSGSEVDPYQISTPQDMNKIGANPSDWGSHFVMVNDVNLAGYTGTQFNIIGYYEGYYDPDNKPFTGVFDGNGLTISNFTYSTIDTDGIGLFGCVDDANAVIKNLTLVTPDVNAAGDSYCVGCLVGYLGYGTITGCGIEGGSVTGYIATGGLVGENWNGTISNSYAAGSVSGHDLTGGLVGGNSFLGSTISNCYVTGSVTGGESTGGLVGYNSIFSTISNCYVAGSVSGGDYTGGLVGRSLGTISNCRSSAGVTGDLRTGGLVGENTLGTILNCYAAGSVTGTGYETGGLVGQNYKGTISNCHTEGSITGTGYETGGLVGYNYDGVISNCYAVGSVTGDVDTGGLVGLNDRGAIENCYATGSVTGYGETGGLVGFNYEGPISNCYAAGKVSASGTSWQSSHSYDRYDNVVVNGMGYYCLEDHTSSSSFEDDLAAGYWQLTTGGLVGYGSSNSYAGSFWNQTVNPSLTGIGNISDPPGVVGESTVNMQKESTFTDAGWDFVEIWNIGEKQTYPFLRSYPAGDLNHDKKVNLLDFAVLSEHWLEGQIN